MTNGIRILLASALVSSLTSSVNASDDDEQNFRVDFTSLNASGVYAKAEIEIEDGKKLKIEIEASGLEFGKPHPQHIHGHSKPVKAATCPDITADTNADGLISVGEGLPSYGPIILPLVPFDIVDVNGELHYEAEFPINPASIQPIHKRVIILHGMTVNGTYIPSLPVACGVITQEIDS